jgi:hypothetical protein
MQDMVDQTDHNKSNQTTLGDFGTSNVPAVEAVLCEMAPDIITVEDIASEFGITESRARHMLEDAVTNSTSRVDLNPVGRGVYHVQMTS